MSKEHKNVYRVLSYIEHLFILISTVTWYISIVGGASLVDISMGVTTYAVGLKLCVTLAGIKKYKTIIMKKKKKRDEISLAKSKLSIAEILNSKTLIHSDISHDEFFLINHLPIKKLQLQIKV